MKRHCPMCGEQWNEDVCAACGWYEGKPARYSTKTKHPKALDLFDAVCRLDDLADWLDPDYGCEADELRGISVRLKRCIAISLRAQSGER